MPAKVMMNTRKFASKVESPGPMKLMLRCQNQKSAEKNSADGDAIETTGRRRHVNPFHPTG
jgi:hypothetical protein